MTYAVFHPLIAASPRVMAQIERHNTQSVPASKEVNAQVGLALYEFISGIQKVGAPADGKSTPELDRITENLYAKLSVVSKELFGDSPISDTKVFVSMPEQSPFIIVFGKSFITLPDTDDHILLEWVTQNFLQDSETTHLMGGMVLISVNQALEDRHPGLMERAQKQEVSLEEIISLIEKDIVQPS